MNNYEHIFCLNEKIDNIFKSSISTYNRKDKVDLKNIKRVQCSCDHCGESCNNIPGMMLPSEAIHGIQTYGKEKFTIDWYENLTTEILMIRPRAEGENRFAVSDLDTIKGKMCSMLTPKGCLFDIEDRPIECATAMNCKYDPSISYINKSNYEFRILWDSSDESKEAIKLMCFDDETVEDIRKKIHAHRYGMSV